LQKPKEVKGCCPTAPASWLGSRAYHIPKRSFTAIKLSVYRNAKLQLGWQIADAKLELGVPSRADFTLNLMAVKRSLGTSVTF